MRCPECNSDDIEEELDEVPTGMSESGTIQWRDVLIVSCNSCGYVFDDIDIEDYKDSKRF